MNRRFYCRCGRLTVAAALALLCMSTPIQQLIATPQELHLPQGQVFTLILHVPGRVEVQSSDARVVQATPISTKPGAAVSVLSQDIGEAIVSTRLFGFLPWKAVHVSVVPREYVVVGGQSIGVILHSRGLIVIGFERVGTRQHSPAADANVEIGDVVEKVNGITVHDVLELRKIVNRTTGPVQLSMRHGRAHRVVIVSPITDSQGYSHLGMFVRETATGVGTLTFYDAKRHRFGALGHLVTDADTGQPIDGTGPVYASEVTGVVKGSPGNPGEKRGRFVRAEGKLGQIDENTLYGVFGSMHKLPKSIHDSVELPVATPDQVHKGPAEIWTVIAGQAVTPYRVEIENLVRQSHPATKSMVVHVVDQRLLGQTGGIIQGMSGSPIVQDGRLVGAVTHVFVSDPTRGYGVYAMWMVSACNHPAGEDTLSTENIPAMQPRYLGPANAGGV